MNARNNTEFYDTILNAKIQQSIVIGTRILLQNPETNFCILQNTFISILSYIGSYISLYDIKLWLNAIEDVNEFIEDEKVDIKKIYIIITKLCILCDIYMKSPVVKTGTMGVKILREKIIDMFTNDKFKLTEVGISRFEGIMPPSDSPSYGLALQIITGCVYNLNQIENMSSDDNKLADVAIKLRNAFDYIIRKKYVFETKFYETDSDAIWFIWGLISLLFHEQEIEQIYKIFNFEYSKKLKTSRIGLLWGSAIAMIYIKKKNISRNWNDKEVLILAKINEVGMNLYKDIKRQLIESNEIVDNNIQARSTHDGMDFLSNFRPFENNVSHVSNVTHDTVSTNGVDSVKYIKCKSRYI